MPQRVRITEVGPRDGLQNEARIIPVDQKVELVRRLAACGLDEIEVTSFVSPRWIPQLADGAEVLAAAADFKPDGCIYSALVPNEQGLHAALRVNEIAQRRLLDKLAVFTAASETFSLKNTNATIAETVKRFRPIAAAARRERMPLRAYISCVIQCPFEGPIAPAAVGDVAARLLDLGADEIDLGDTIGAATPDTLRRLLDAVAPIIGEPFGEKLTLHLHDTNGRAADCAEVALRLGLRSFDGAAGGLGGCPYASTPQRRAPGNLATEMLVKAVHAAGFATGVDLEALAEAANCARHMVGLSREKTPR